MTDLLSESARLLSEVGYSTATGEADKTRILVFESNTVLGFVFAYETPGALLSTWQADAEIAIVRSQLGLRRAQQKAWNAYTILLAQSAANFAEAVALSVIEEDLVGTRKIARAGLADPEDIRAALLPLLPIQNSPRLDTVDMAHEIRLRTTELSSHVVDAFLSHAQEGVVAQAIEDAP